MSDGSGAPAPPVLLLLRPADHLIAAVAWTVEGGTSRLELILPPQHVGEQPSPDGPASLAQGDPPAAAILSGPSRLVVDAIAGPGPTVQAVLDHFPAGAPPAGPV